MNNHNHRKIQSGFSLIELLIAMLLGVFLLAGIASSYVSSKKTSRDSNELSQLEDNGRIALETIRDIIQHTGYSPNNNASFQPFIINPTITSDVCSDGSNNVVNPALFTGARITKDGDNSDSLAVTYYGDNNLFTDCLGNALPAACRLGTAGVSNNAAKIHNSFFVTNNKLKCVGSRTNRAHTIADGIENIQYLYGVDTDGDNSIDKYLTATNISVIAAANPSIWNAISSIQVAVLVRSLKPIKPTAESKSYTLLDTTITSNNDRFKRQVFTTTIRLRNLQ